VKRAPLIVVAFVLGGLLAEGCGSSDEVTTTADAATPPAEEAGPGVDGGPAPDAAPDATTGCPRTLAPADRARKVVISHPFLEAGGKAKDFEVLDLAADGTLTRPKTPVTFAMGTALYAPVVFTPDGEVGLVAQDDGSIGVFRLPAGGGAPVVVHAAFAGDFYAGGIVLAPDGSHGWVLDSNTANNGGGVYAIRIACDGTLTSGGLVVPGGGATAMALLPTDPTKALLSSIQAFTSPLTTDLHLIDLAANKELASVSAFGDLKAIVSSIAIMPDGKHALVTDDGLNVGDRVAVVRLGATLSALSLLQTPFPSGAVASPFGNAAFVLNGDSSDQIHVLSYDATKPAPFVITGELAYQFAKPQIPTTASSIDRGKLRGTVLVGENLGVRKLVFGADGKVTDASKLGYPDAIANIVGVVGVQP
jgi:DNA-binding beta-propeller fold protein YncE